MTGTELDAASPYLSPPPSRGRVRERGTAHHGPGVAACYVELLGPARLAAGAKSVSVEIDAPTPIPAFLHALAGVCQQLVGTVLDASTGLLVEGHTLNRGGRDFLKAGDLIQPGDRLLLLSSAAGG